MKIIGITGGVGCGKSEVIRYIVKNYNCYVIFADDVAKQLQEKGNVCYDEIVALLGEDILEEGGQIHKGKMAEKIFGNEELLQKVNAIVHPAVMEYVQKKMKEQEEENCVDFFLIEAALLIECGYGDIVDEMWYVYTADEIRRERLKESRGYSDEKIDQIFASQLSYDEFKNACTFLLDNSGEIEMTHKQIDNKLEEYLCQK